MARLYNVSETTVFRIVSRARQAGEERETNLQALRQALKEGEDSGRTDYSLSGLIDELDGESAN